MKTFDYILNNRVKMGKYQFKVVGIVGLIEFIDGLEYLYLSILLSILKKEWDLNQSTLSMLGSSYFLGIVCGNILCALIADKVGRRLVLIISCILQILTMLLTSLVENANQLAVLRLLYGILFGVTIPLSFVVASEIVVNQYRGRVGQMLGIIYVFGKIYLCLLCFIFLDDYSSGNWRGLIRFNVVPATVCLLGALFILNDNARYLLSQRRFTEAFQEINRMGKENQGDEFEKLTDNEKDKLINWLNVSCKSELDSKQFFELFSTQYRECTLKLWLIMVAINIQNTGLFLLIPFLFETTNSGFMSLIIVCLAELCANIIGYQVIDNVRFGGRRNLVIFGSIIAIASNFAIYYWKASVVVLSIIVMKFAFRFIFQTTLMISCESYSSVYRSMGTASAQCIGKISAVPVPYIVFPIYFINPYWPFLFNIGLSIVMLITAISYPIDKTLQDLEQYDQENKTK